MAGDSAIETALALAEQNHVIIVNRRDGFHRAAAGNRNVILAAIADERIECYYNTVPRFIEERTGRAHIALETLGELKAVSCDKIIARLGASHPRAFLESCGIAFSDAAPTALPTLNAQYESSVKGLYVIGSLAGYPLIKQSLNQGFEVVEQIRGKPVQPVEDELLLDKFLALPNVSTAEAVLATVSNTIALFATIDARTLRGILLESRILSPRPGSAIYTTGDYTDSFYSILSGEVHMKLENNEADLNIRLKKGEFFGDTELISGQRRTPSAVAGENCILIESPRLTIKKLSAGNRTVSEMLEIIGIERALRWYLTPGLLEEDFKQLAEKISSHCFETGEVLFQEGDSTDSVYFLRSGAVKTTHTSGQHQVPSRLVSAGDFVGGWSAMTNSARRATARAMTETATVEIPGNEFRVLLQHYPELRKEIQENVLQNHVGKMGIGEETGAIISCLMSHGVGEATDVLLIDESICIRCDNCEKACADTHGGNSRLNREAGPTVASIHLPTSCRHCVQPHCMNDCPPNAIHRAANGEVFINDTCIGCGNCVQNCPYDVIHLASDNPEKKPSLWARLLFGVDKAPNTASGCSGNKKAVKCDMCKDLSGGPACVSACPTGAAFRGNPEHILFNALNRPDKQLQVAN